jgi:uncharacterized protein DUF4386
MVEQGDGASPRALARLAGVLYLVIIAIGLWGELFVRGKLVVEGDAVATAANLRSQESLWRWAIAGELVLLTCAIIVLWILYVLLRPANRELAVLAVLFNLVAIAVEAATTLRLLDALFPLGDRPYLAALASEQRYALTNLALRSHAYGFGISLFFFGGFLLVAGYLVYISGYLPKAIGLLYQLAGVCYLANSLVLIVAPAFADRAFLVILPPAFVGELALAVWLLLKGVDVAAWQRAAARQLSR